MKTTRLRAALLTVVPVLAAAALAVVATAPSASAASLQEVTGYGNDLSKLKMYVYVPDNVAPRPAVVVAVHSCHSDALQFYAGSQFASLADRYGFVVVYPSVTQAADRCFDVASKPTLQHGGGSDSFDIVSMVRYAHQRYNGDPARTFAVGVSSGAMMTNVLLGAYPDVFAAGVAFAGVPFGCFAGPTSWNGDCANGLISRTPQEWGDLVRAAYPGWTGPRPRMQLWHGTEDTVLHYRNFGEAIKQWTNVLGTPQTPVSTDQPQPGWTRTRYRAGAGPVVLEAISMQGVPHNLPVNAPEAISFFGLDRPAPTASPTPSGSPSASASPSPSVSPSASASPSASVSSSVSPTRSPSATPVPTGSGGCTATYTVGSSWTGGFVANVKVTAGSVAVTRWTVTLALPTGTSVANGWSGQFSGSSGTVQVTNANYNGQLGAGQSADFGFQGAGVGTGVTATCTAG